MRGICEHLIAWKNQTGGAAAYRPIQRSLHVLWIDKSDPVKAAELPAVVCLHCAAAARGLKAHCSEHAPKCHHAMALDVKRSELFCCACMDYIHDPDFDRCISGAAAAALSGEGGAGASGAKVLAATANGVKRKRSEDMAGVNLQQLGPRIIQRGHDLPFGLRGLSNLGNTCFMNSVLQALLHAPLLRNFYLSGAHSAALCPHRQASKPCLSCELDGLFSAAYSGASAPFSPAAFLYAWWCHADHHLASYQQQDAHEFYLFALSGLSHSRLPADGAAASPAAIGGQPGPPAVAGLPGGPPRAMRPQLVYNAQLLGIGSPPRPLKQEAGSAGWQVPVLEQSESLDLASDLDSAALPLLLPLHHSDTKFIGVADDQASCRNRASSPGMVEGESVLQRIFGGLLQSDVTCCACGHTSTAHDPFLDISLDIKPPPPPPPLLLRPPGPVQRQPNGQRRLSGAAAMAVAAAQKRAASAAGGDFSAGTSGDTFAPLGEPATAEGAAAAAPSGDLIGGFGVTAATQLPGDRASPDTTATSLVGEAASAVPGAGNSTVDGDDSSESLDIIGTYSRRESSPPGAMSALTEEGEGAVNGAPTRGGSTEGDGIEGYHSSVPEASAAFASTTRAALSSEGASSGIVGDSQGGTRDEIMTSPAPEHTNGLERNLTRRPPSAPQLTSTPRFPSAPLLPARVRAGSAGGKKPRPTRCMKCATCLKPQLKKACLRNKALRSAGSLAALDAALLPSVDPPEAPAESTPALNRMNGAEGDVQGAVSRSGSFSFATRSSLPLHERPRAPLTAGIAPASLHLAEANGAAPATRSAPAAAQTHCAAQSGGEAGRRTPPPPVTAPRGVTADGVGAAGGPAPVTAQYGAANLLGCLHRFVRPESLGPGERWTCERCRLQQRAVKQMSIRRLPPVLCLHVKRFEHMGVGKKLNTPLIFSAHLDMRPYLSSTVLQRRFAAKQPPSNGRPGEGPADANVSMMYELYAVVCHRGNLQGGHYVAYVKCKSSWYLCDDGFVLEVDEETACSPHAYMLYYRHKGMRC